MKLVLRTKSKEGKHPLYFKMYVKEGVSWFKLGISVDVNEWNEASQSERKMTNYLNRKGISKKIALIDDAVADMRRHHRLTKENLNISIEKIVLSDKREQLKHIEDLNKEIEDKRKSNVKNFVVSYVDRIISGDARTSKGERYTKLSCKNWKQFKRIFLDFYTIHPFTWDDINKTLVDTYISYLEGLGYMRYTINKNIKNFRTLVGIAECEGLHNNHIARGKLQSPTVREQDKAKEIYLTTEELSALYEMPLEGFYDTVRDVFLIGCFTALRFSDYCGIEESDIGYTASGTKVIRLLQKKTGAPVVIPIMDDRLETLLKKYDYNVPNLWGESLNRAIKKICKKLSETVPSLAKKERTLLKLGERRAEEKAKKDGKTLYEYDEKGFPLKHKWELVSSHTARRSCITNMVLSKKFTIQQMMSVSGHKSQDIFNKYVKLSLDDVADTVASSARDGLF